MIVVIDYDVGNVRSVCNAFRHIGCEVKLSRKSEDIKTASGLVLPGVAAFGYAVNALGPLAERVKVRLSSGRRTTEKQRNSNNCSLKRKYSGMCQ